jgi:hypothetical protein
MWWQKRGVKAWRRSTAAGSRSRVSEARSMLPWLSLVPLRKSMGQPMNGAQASGAMPASQARSSSVISGAFGGGP